MSCTDLNGIEHTVEVSAESIFEAVARAWKVFQESPWVGGVFRGCRYRCVRQGTRDSTSGQIKRLQEVGSRAGSDACGDQRAVASAGDSWEIAVLTSSYARAVACFRSSTFAFDVSLDDPRKPVEVILINGDGNKHHQVADLSSVLSIN